MRDAKLTPDKEWAPLIKSIAAKGEPNNKDFIPAVEREEPELAWDALGAASFWYYAVGGEIPDDHVSVAEQLAEAAEAEHII